MAGWLFTSLKSGTDSKKIKFSRDCFATEILIMFNFKFRGLNDFNRYFVDYGEVNTEKTKYREQGRRRGMRTNEHKTVDCNSYEKV